MAYGQLWLWPGYGPWPTFAVVHGLMAEAMATGHGALYGYGLVAMAHAPMPIQRATMAYG